MFNKMIALLKLLLLMLASYACFAVKVPTSSLNAASTASAISQTARYNTEPLPVALFAVQLDGKIIFEISTTPVASLSPEVRAKLIQDNILKFANGSADVATLKMIPRPEGIGIGDGKNILLVVTDADGIKEGQTSVELSKHLLAEIKSAITTYRQKHTWKVYALAASFTVASILGLWLALYWNKRAFIWLENKVSKIKLSWDSGLTLKGIEVISSSKIEWLLIKTLRMFKLLVLLLLMYFLLPLTLSFFPETKKLSGKIFDYFLAPFVTIFNGFVKYIPNMFFIIVIGVVAYYALKLLSSIFSLIEKGELKFEWFHDDWAKPTYQIVRFLVIVTALISAYPYIPGSSSQAFQGVGLVLGAIISFASSSAISNIVAGIILTYTRAFRLNDRIKVGETTGDVVEKTLLVTRIKTIKNVIITIPNSLVMGAQIINYSTSAKDGVGVILHTSVTIGYDVPFQQVQQLLIAAALATDRLLKDPVPFVFQTSLDDYYVSYEINAFTTEPERMAVIYSDLHQSILEKFDEAGVEIMSPHYYALRDGNASSVPSILTGDTYQAPSFQIKKLS